MIIKINVSSAILVVCQQYGGCAATLHKITNIVGLIYYVIGTV